MRAIVMRKFFSALIIVPLSLLLVVFAVANRHFVTVSFDPFDSTDPALSASLPLFVLVIAAAIVGVIAGGCATWFGQRRWRRAARRHEADARTAKTQLTELRAATLASSRGDMVRVPPAAQVGFYGAGRDKQNATL
jgi:uncharacterized integral membrane protein